MFRLAAADRNPTFDPVRTGRRALVQWRRETADGLLPPRRALQMADAGRADAVRKGEVTDGLDT